MQSEQADWRVVLREVGMKRTEIVFLVVLLLVVVLLVVMTANLDLFFPTPGPVEFAKAAINRTGAA